MAVNPSRVWITVWDNEEGTAPHGPHIVRHMVNRGYDPEVAIAINRMIFYTAGSGLENRILRSGN